VRVAFYSPLPPERSGIADYSYELLEELRHHVDIVSVVAEKQLGLVRAPDGVELVGSAAADDLDVDCNLYQMGNNSKYHRFFYGRAFEEPGLLVMHDPSLADFTAEMCGGAEGAIFRDEVAYDRPDIRPADDLPLVDVGDGRKDIDRIQVLLARRILESNVRTLVHSSAMAREMRRRYPNCDVRTIQLPAPVLSEPEWKLRRPPGEVVFGVFGGINYYKRVRPLVDAFVEVRKRHPLARMVIAGRADDHLLERELRAISTRREFEGSLEVKTDLSLAELEHEMQRCDVGISLRWPTAGEMSATLMRTFGAGRPAIVSDVLQFRELDEQYCWRVTTDFDREHENLVELMDRLAGDPGLCQRAGEAARGFVQREATYQIVAAQYVEHLEHCAAKRSAKWGARARLSLPASRPLGVNVIVPSLAGEVAEAARRTAAALRSAGTDVVVVELSASQDRSSSDARSVERGGKPSREGRDGRLQAFEDDRSDSDLVELAVRALDPADVDRVSSGPYPIDLVFVDPREAERIGHLARVRRHRGRWIVPVLGPAIDPLPRDHGLLLELAEHVVAPSEHAAEVVRLSTIGPVSVVPWPLAPKDWSAPTGRSIDSCTFLTVAREDSLVTRANPLAVLAAFRRAIPSSQRGDHARLVVVFEGASARAEALDVLATEVGEVSGLLVVDPSPTDLDDLVDEADAFVSLHRAEGFGLQMADAMAIGKPVIATGYSGNLDYMNEKNACLVGYDVRMLDEGDVYLDPGATATYGRGSFWIDPDLDGAARWMSRIADNRGLRDRIAGAAAAETNLRLAPDRVGCEMWSLLAGLELPRRSRNNLQAPSGDMR
jgi:glycosyltransferase involved in cell wall biosynthesis